MLGRRPSYVWRSILAAKEVVVSRSRWVVGNGEQINIWKDRWLPTPDSFKVVYQNTSKNGDTKDSSKSRGAEDQRLNHRIDDPTTEHKRQGCTSEG